MTSGGGSALVLGVAPPNGSSAPRASARRGGSGGAAGSGPFARARAEIAERLCAGVAGARAGAGGGSGGSVGVGGAGGVVVQGGAVSGWARSDLGGAPVGVGVDVDVVAAGCERLPVGWTGWRGVTRVAPGRGPAGLAGGVVWGPSPGFLGGELIRSQVVLRTSVVARSWLTRQSGEVRMGWVGAGDAASLSASVRPWGWAGASPPRAGRPRGGGRTGRSRGRWPGLGAARSWSPLAAGPRPAGHQPPGGPGARS